jgi:UDP-glucose 4-epimerase
VEKPQIIYHLAAQVNVGVSQQEPCLDADSNIMGTLKLLTYVTKYKVKKIVFTSSAAIYGNPVYLPVDENHPALPLSFYGLSKYTAECYIKLFAATFGLRYTILRFSNVYGPRQQATGEGGVIAQFISRFLKGEAPVIYGDGEQTRDFIYVSDVVAACCKALYMGDNQTLNISTNRTVAINQLCQQLKNIKEWSSPPLYNPWREGDILHSVLDNSKARSLLLWNPRSSLSEGLKKTVYKKQKTTLTEW